MQVAICSDGIFPLDVGGIQRHTRLLTETLARRHPDLELVVVHPHEGRRVFADLANVREITVAPRPGKSHYILECYGLAARMRDVLLRLPDAIIYSEGVLGWIRSGALRPRMIINPHGLEAFQSARFTNETLKGRMTGMVFRSSARLGLRNARYVVSLGGSLTTILRREISDPVHRLIVIPNGVSVPTLCGQLANVLAEPLKVLFVGRFAANKGISDLIAAARLLHEQGPVQRFHFDLVGDGPLLSELASANTLGNVSFHGSVDDHMLDRFYRDAHIFVLPTLFEGMPTVVLEAMARRLPVLVTDVGATREMVDEHNGFIIEKRCPRDIANKLNEFASLPASRRIAMGDASRMRVIERFSWEVVADAHYSLFQSLRSELDFEEQKGALSFPCATRKPRR